MPTLNADRYIEQSLRSIRDQDYPQEHIRILIADGGSTDRTIEIAKNYRVDEIVANEGVTTEAGLAVLNRLADTELVAYIDADNFLPDRDWISKMVIPFRNADIFAAEPLYWYYDSNDAPLNRYFALSGINDPVSLFLGNYARHSTLTRKWTNMPHEEIQREGYIEVDLKPGSVPVMGHNGFMVRTEVIHELPVSEFYFDVDAVAELVSLGHTRLAKVDVSIGHHFSRNLKAFRRKTRRRIEDFNYFRNHRTYPWLDMSFGRYLKFVAYTLLIIPLVIQSLQGFVRTKDPAWFYHVPVCWLTLIFYTYGTIVSRIRQRPYSRADYRY